MIGAISNALSGLLAAGKRVDASASNIANAQSAGSLEQDNLAQPYQALTTVQTANGETGGTIAHNIPKIPGIVNAYAPDSPFANAQGQIGVPDVNLGEELINLKIAEIAYKANILVLKTAADISDSTNSLFDKKI